MIRSLLLWGMLAGLFGGVLAMGASLIIGEPLLDRAIAYEEASAAPEPAAVHTHADGTEHEHEHAAATGGGHTHAAEGTSVSRGLQRTVGLLTATGIYGVAVGGLFAIAFAFAYGRVGRVGPARTGLLMALGAFVVIYLVPFVRFPASPPGTGGDDLIGQRTAAYFVMVAISLLAVLAAVRVHASLRDRLGPDGSVVAALGLYVAVVLAGGLLLPSPDIIPDSFPADTLWSFRVASVTVQAVLWAGLGTLFAFGAERTMRRSVGAPAVLAQAEPAR